MEHNTNTTRDSLRNSILTTIQKENIILLEWATGVGKSLAAITIQEKINGNTLILVSELTHISNWKTEFIKHNKENLLNNTTFLCYSSLHKIINKSFDLIICDEAHHISEKRLENLQTLNFKKLILLTATITNEKLIELQNLGKITVNSFALDKAIKSTILPPPTIYLIPLKLDNYNKNEFIVETWGKKNLRQKYICKNENDAWTFRKNRLQYKDVELNIPATEQECYDYFCKQADYYYDLFIKTADDHCNQNWLYNCLQRKLLLGKLKTKYAKELLITLKDKRLICFCSSIKQSELLSKTGIINSRQQHNQKLIDDFNNQHLDKLFVVGMLQEGVNLTNIDCSIVIQLDNNNRSFIQKLGRSLRSTKPVQYVLYFKDTVDEKFLKNITNNIEEDYLEIISLDELEKLNNN